MEANVHIVKDWYTAIQEGEPERAVSLLSPDCRWTEMEGFPYAGTYMGVQAIVENVFMRLATEWDDFSFEPDAFHDAGDTVIVTGHYSGNFKETCKYFRCRTVHMWTLDDGKIVRFEQFTDTLLVSKAMA